MDRNLATYYMNYAPNDPRARSSRPDYIKTVKSINSNFRYFEEFFTNESVDLVIKRPDKGLGACDYICNKIGVPTTFPMNNRYKDYVTWNFSSLFDSRQIKETWKKSSVKKISEEKEIIPPTYALNNYEIFKEIISIRYLLKNVLKTFITYLDFFQSDLRKLKLFKNKNRLPFLGVLLKHLTTFFSAKNMQYLQEGNIEKLTKRPYLLYLLQLEPELGSNTQAKEFNNSFAIAQQISLSLPTGYNLIIKENVWAIGSRRFSFYRDLAKMPNIIWADPRLPSGELIKRSEGVATLTGTVPIEAARLGKCSLVFSIRTEYGFLPSVSIVNSFFDLPSIIRTKILNQSDSDKCKYIKAGWKYVESMKTLSFDAQGTFWFGKNKRLNKKEFNKSIDLLIKNWKDQKRIRFKS